MAVYVTPLRYTSAGVRAILRADTPKALMQAALMLDLDLTAIHEPHTYRAGFDLLPHERETALGHGVRSVSFTQMKDLLNSWRTSQLLRERQLADLL